MAAKFATLEKRLNTSVFAHLSNTGTVVLDGLPTTGIFDIPDALGSVGMYGMASTAPTLTLATSDVPPSPEGMVAVIRDKRYRVATHEPDGTGVSRLMLETLP